LSRRWRPEPFYRNGRRRPIGNLRYGHWYRSTYIGGGTFNMAVRSGHYDPVEMLAAGWREAGIRVA
jgi:hypothetical protein